MAIRLSTDLLLELGYGALTEAEGRRLLKDLYDAGETLVGARIAQTMSEDQLEQFEKFVDADDDPGALAWLQRNFPGYQDTVEEVFRELQASLAELAAQRLSTRSSVGGAV